MLRQYGQPQRARRVETPKGPMMCGTIPVGAIVRPHNARCRVIVEAWLPRDYAVYSAGRFTTKRITGGHLAQVRRLDNGARFTLSDCWLLDADD